MGIKFSAILCKRLIASTTNLNLDLSTGVSQRNILTIQNYRVRNIFQLSTVVSAIAIDAAIPHLELLTIH